MILKQVIQNLLMPLLLFLFALIFNFFTFLVSKVLLRNVKSKVKAFHKIGLFFMYYRIEKNRLVQGYLFNFYNFFAESIHTSFSEKSQIKVISILGDIAVIWFFMVISIDEFEMSTYLRYVFYGILFVLGYSFVNASFIKSIGGVNETIEKIVNKNLRKEVYKP